MKKVISNLKENKFLRIYLILFSILNVIYVSFLWAKFYYADKYGLEGTIQMNSYEYLSRITRITRYIETIILLMFLVYLIKVIIKKDKINLKQFLIIHFLFFIIIIFIKSLISIAFPKYFWASIQILFRPIQIIILILIYFLIIILYKKLFKKLN